MNKNIILLIVSFVMFMEAVDATIINTAIPAMAQSLQVNPIDLKIALISYLLSLAIFIPISGWIVDKFGVKKIFITAIVVFTLSSFWCGMTTSLPELVLARIVQGLGGSLTVPVGRLIILRTCERRELITKMNIVVMVASLGLMLGPVLGGVITTHFSWRWIFWVNIPVGILTIIGAMRFLEYVPPREVPPLDKIGFLLFGVGLATLTFGLSTLSESNISLTEAFMIIFVSCMFLMTYIFYSRKRKHPIVKTELFQLRTFQISVLGNLFSRLGFGGVPFLVPLLLQVGLGYSPQLSGLLLAPTALGVLLVKPLSIHLLRFFGYKKYLIGNTFLVSLSLFAFATIDSNTSIYLIGIFTFIFGILMTLQYSGMNSLAYADVSQDDLSSATSIMSTMQQIAQSFGVAAAALFVRLFSQGILTPSAFHQTFIALAVLTFFSVLIFVRLSQLDGQGLIARETSVASDA